MAMYTTVILALLMYNTCLPTTTEQLLSFCIVWLSRMCECCVLANSINLQHILREGWVEGLKKGQGT